MMPDGAEPCKGFRELLAEADRHIKTIAELRHENERANTGAGEGAGKTTGVTDIGFLLPDLLAGVGQLRSDNERLRRWVYATARSFEGSGLSLEEYNAITAEVCRALEPKP